TVEPIHVLPSDSAFARLRLHLAPDPRAAIFEVIVLDRDDHLVAYLEDVAERFYSPSGVVLRPIPHGEWPDRVHLVVLFFDFTGHPSEDRILSAPVIRDRATPKDEPSLSERMLSFVAVPFVVGWACGRCCALCPHGAHRKKKMGFGIAPSGVRPLPEGRRWNRCRCRCRCCCPRRCRCRCPRRSGCRCRCVTLVS